MDDVVPRLLPCLLGLVLLVLLCDTAAPTSPRSGRQELRGPPLAYNLTEWEDTCSAPSLAWLRNYTAWHRRMRALPHDPATHKYLVWMCLEGYPCKGLGDRVRGMMFLLRLASAMDRILLIKQLAPGPMEEYLAPSGIIDWTLQGPPDDELLRPGNWILGNHQPWLAWYRSWWTYDGYRQTWLATQTNTLPHQQYGDMPRLDPDDLLSHHCLFHTLFTASPLVIREAERSVSELRVNPRQPYVAVHLRLGGMVGEDMLPKFEKTALPSLLSSLSCARMLASRVDIDVDRQNILLMTDNNALREHASRGYFTGVSSPPLEVRHFEKGGDGNSSQTEHEHLLTTVDLLLLAQATCLVTSSSSFSAVALWWSMTSCTVAVQTCLTDMHRHHALQ